MSGGLTDFEGLPVRQAGIEIPGAAGGLRESMKIDPQEFHKGDRVRVLLDCVVDKVRFDPIDKEDPTGDQRRVHIFGVDLATIVPAGFGDAELAEQREQIRLAKEAEAGIQRLPYGEELQAAHDRGEHAEGLVRECPSCEAEAAAIEKEAAESGANADEVAARRRKKRSKSS